MELVDLGFQGLQGRGVQVRPRSGPRRGRPLQQTADLGGDPDQRRVIAQAAVIQGPQQLGRSEGPGRLAGQVEVRRQALAPGRLQGPGRLGIGRRHGGQDRRLVGGRIGVGTGVGLGNPAVLRRGAGTFLRGPAPKRGLPGTGVPGPGSGGIVLRQAVLHAAFLSVSDSDRMVRHGGAGSGSPGLAIPRDAQASAPKDTGRP